MRIGYRNSKSNFEIDSDVEQFNFSLSHKHLIVNLNWKVGLLAPVERINIYLTNNILYQNIFVVNSNMFYYYEKSWYYEYNDVREGVPVPKENILTYLDFKIEDILLIEVNNNPRPASFDIKYWLMPIKTNVLDSKKSIDSNIFIEEKRWEKLSIENKSIIYEAQLSQV
jgi:hypothetical protein